jgi:hypothetical protein
MGALVGEQIPELMLQGLQQLIELEEVTVLVAERHERSDDCLGSHNIHRPCLLTTQGRLKVSHRAAGVLWQPAQ